MSSELRKHFQLVGLEWPVGCGSYWIVPWRSPNGTEGSGAPGGMHSSVVLFPPTTWVSAVQSKTAFAPLKGALPTQTSFVCQLPASVFWSFLYQFIVSIYKCFSSVCGFSFGSSHFFF